MAFIFEIIKLIVSLIVAMFVYLKIAFNLFLLGLELFIVSFVYDEKIIGALLPFSKMMKNQKKKRTIFYLLFFITLRLAVAIFAWSFVIVPFVDAYLQGYFSILFHALITPLSIVLAIGFYINVTWSFELKIKSKERIISTLSLFYNYWSRMFLKILYFFFLLITLIMLYSANKGILDETVVATIAKYDKLNVFTLFIVSILYAFIDRYAAVKIHQYFYYYFNLSISKDEYDGRLQELSKHYTILYTELDKYVYPDIDKQIYPRLYERVRMFSLLEELPGVEYIARKIVLRNKYLPISFTLIYYTTNNEACYFAVNLDSKITSPRRVSLKNNMGSDSFSREEVIQENYSEKRKRLLEEPRKVKFPLGKILITGRIISIILIIFTIFFMNGVDTWEMFLEKKIFILSLLFIVALSCWLTYVIAWFHMNIVIILYMYVMFLVIDLAAVPALFIASIIITVILNLMVLSFWKQDKIEQLLNVHFIRPADKKLN